MNTELNGQVAIVTSGSHGLGRSIAFAPASAGAAVVVASWSDEESAAVAGELTAATGVTAIGQRCDVTVEADINELVGATMTQFGRLDILVNSAGVNIRGAIQSVSLADFDRCLAVNVTGIRLACRTVADPMMQAGYGRILNMASALGLVGTAERSLYAAAKGAVVQLTRALAIEWAKFEGLTRRSISFEESRRWPPEKKGSVFHGSLEVTG